MMGFLSQDKSSKRALHPIFSLRWKTLLVVLPLILITFVVFTLLHVLISRNHLISTTEDFVDHLARALSFNIARGYEIDNSRSLYQLVTEYIAYDSRIVSVSVIKQGGEITADSDQEKVFSITTDPKVHQVLREGSTVMRRYSEGAQEYYETIVPIYVWESHIVNGALVLRYDASEMFQTLRKLQTASIVGSLFLIILIALGIALVLERNVTGPLERLTLYVSHVDVLNPSVSDLDIKSKDEIGTLARTFTQLLQNLREANAELTRRAVEIEQAYKQLQETEVQLIQSEKMASLGQLTAGIAHEVNNPMNFVYGNLGLMEKCFHEMKQLLQAYEKASIRARDLKRIGAIKNKMDYETVLNDLDGMIADCKTGAKRTVEIVRELRDFSRMENGEIQTIDINESLDTTLKLLRPSYKGRIEVKKEYGDLPPYSGYSGQISQVFMNVMMNAIQAIEGRGSILVHTSTNGERVSIEISDTGHGIPKEIAHKIFDPFYTTKEVGQGTGLGLSISYQIVQQHGGAISFESQVGKGTRMRIDLPISGVTNHGA